MTAPVDGAEQQFAIHIKYGVVDGVVQSVSGDAIEDERLGLVYCARIKLKKNSIHVRVNLIALSLGMALTSKVNTDKRKVIYCFLTRCNIMRLRV